MPVNYGLIVNQGGETTIAGSAMTPIAVIGTGNSGTAVSNTLYQIKSRSRAEDLFGLDDGSATLPKALSILFRYGCGNIIVVQVDEGATAGDTETNIIGGFNATTGNPEGLELIKNSYSSLGESPEILLTPTFNTDSVITKGLEVADYIKGSYIVNYAPLTTVADVQASRGGATALGQKAARLIATFPHLENTNNPGTYEELATHVAGVIAQVDLQKTYGHSPGSKLLSGVSGLDVNLSMSYTDETADNQVLADLGVMSVNRDQELVTWGHRNTLFSDPATDLKDTEKYINAIRARDVITKILEARSRKFIDKPSNRQTAHLLEESMRTALSQEVSRGAISANSTVEFAEGESSYSEGILTYQVELGVLPPTRLIEVNALLMSFGLSVEI